MAMADSEGAENFDISRVISRSFETIGGNAPVFLGLALILSGIPSAVFNWWQLGNATASTTDPSVFLTPAFWGPVAIALFLGVITNAVLQASITRATVLSLSGEQPDFVACLAVGLTMILPMIAIGLLAGLGIFAGLILLIVPGIILWLVWSVVVPAYVQEKLGIVEAFGRSAALTKGARGKIFLLFLAIVIGIWLLGIPVAMLGVAAGAATPLLTVLVQAVYNAVTSMLMVTMQASVYVELRDIKEGVGPADLEAIFA
jgi:hypothetical protein